MLTLDIRKNNATGGLSKRKVNEGLDCLVCLQRKNGSTQAVTAKVNMPDDELGDRVASFH